MPAGQRKVPPELRYAREQARRRARERQSDVERDQGRHDEHMRGLALQAAAAMLAPHYAPLVMRTEDTPYSDPRDVLTTPDSDLMPGSLNRTGDQYPAAADAVMALAERFEVFIGAASTPPDHPGLADGGPDPSPQVPQHPGLD